MIKLNENIKKYRLQKEMTQAQLASVFNVSDQAVSRWENGNTYPDIQLLPALADFFDISIDELMGMENYKDEKEIEEILNQVKDYERKGLINESIKILQDAAQKYPKNYTILLYLAEMLNFEYNEDEEAVKRNSEKAIEVVDRILDECKDRMTCNYAINAKIIALRELGRIDEAKKIAEAQPNVWNSSNFRLMELYKGDELKQHCENNAMQFSQLLYWSIVQQTDLGFENESYTIRDRINIAKKGLEILDVVYEGNYGIENSLVTQMCRYIAAMEILDGKEDATLEYLEKAANHAIIYDSLPDKFELTSTLLKGHTIELNSTFKNFTTNESTLLYNKLSDSRYNSIRDNERFITIKDNLEKYIIK